MAKRRERRARHADATSWLAMLSRVRRKVIKRCPKGHVMETVWLECPRCTGRSPEEVSARGITERTTLSTGPDPGDNTRIVDSLELHEPPGDPPGPTVEPPPRPAPRVECVNVETLESAVLVQGVHRFGKAPPAGDGAFIQTISGDPYVSKHHADLIVGSAEVLIVDKGSTNGTFVNGEKVTRYVLQDGDEMRIGDTAFRFNVER